MICHHLIIIKQPEPFRQPSVNHQLSRVNCRQIINLLREIFKLPLSLLMAITGALDFQPLLRITARFYADGFLIRFDPMFVRSKDKHIKRSRLGRSKAHLTTHLARIGMVTMTSVAISNAAGDVPVT